MKIRVRGARYQDVNHIEILLQEALDTPTGDVSPLPPIERPHIYNLLNDKISRGQLMIAVADDKLIGIGVVDGQTYPWNPRIIIAIGYIVVRRAYHQVGAQALLLAEMANHAHQNGVPMIFQKIPGIASDISDAELVVIGATVDDGGAIFLVPGAMETQTE